MKTFAQISVPQLLCIKLLRELLTLYLIKMTLYTEKQIILKNLKTRNISLTVSSFRRYTNIAS